MMRPLSAARAVCRTPYGFRAYSSARPQVLLMDEIKLATRDLERLSHHADVVVGRRTYQTNTTQSRDELKRAFAPGGAYAHIKGMYRHFGGARSVRISGRFDPELVQALPPSLKFIVHNGAGYDQRTLPR